MVHERTSGNDSGFRVQGSGFRVQGLTVNREPGTINVIL
jgi:hypothetical protein